MKRLEDAGVIEGYAAKINPPTMGLPLAAWLLVRPMPGQLQKVSEILQELPQIVECDPSPARIALSPAPTLLL
jgi:Lrp/AsnC family transcriptional regulator, leucine-responsive regulatory protein